MSKIKSITVKNIKAITEQNINLDGCSAIITAGNNKGKTTLLNVLTDRLRSEKPKVILREGEENGLAEMELTTGEKFLWEVSETKDKLTFFTKDGIKTPLVREISKRYFQEKFDIDKFLSESPKNQALLLQKFLGLELTELDREYKEAYDYRTYKNRLRRKRF